VDRAHRRGAPAEGKVRIQKINKVLDSPDAYGFYFQDLDTTGGRSSTKPRVIDDFFARGDIVDMSVVATDSAKSTSREA